MDIELSKNQVLDSYISEIELELSKLKIDLSDQNKTIIFEISDKKILENRINELKDENTQLNSRVSALIQEFSCKIQKANDL